MPEHQFPIDSLLVGELVANSRVQGYLNVECGTAGTQSLPFLAAKGATPGNTLFIVAGVHGNEYEGMEAIRRVWSEIDATQLHGAFFAIVIANPFAYATKSRATPPHIDGQNLARVFPGDPAGTPTERLAAALLGLVERNVGPDDLFVDLHSGTSEVAFATMVGFRDIQNGARQCSEEAARHMGLPLLWAIPDTQGPFNAETARRGIPTIGTETTGRAGCREEDVTSYERGLWNLLRYLGIVGGSLPDRDAQTPRLTTDVLSACSGFARIGVDLGHEVTEGQTLGQIVDHFGVVLCEIVASITGQIWAVLRSPYVKSGDLIAMIAT